MSRQCRFIVADYKYLFRRKRINLVKEFRTYNCVISVCQIVLSRLQIPSNKRSTKYEIVKVESCHSAINPKRLSAKIVIFIYFVYKTAFPESRGSKEAILRSDFLHRFSIPALNPR